MSLLASKHLLLVAPAKVRAAWCTQAKVGVVKANFPLFYRGNKS